MKDKFFIIIILLCLFSSIYIIIKSYFSKYNERVREILESQERQKLIERIEININNPFIFEEIMVECRMMRKFPYTMYFDMESCISNEFGFTKLNNFCIKKQKEQKFFKSFYDKCIYKIENNYDY